MLQLFWSLLAAFLLGLDAHVGQVLDSLLNFVRVLRQIKSCVLNQKVNLKIHQKLTRLKRSIVFSPIIRFAIKSSAIITFSLHRDKACWHWSDSISVTAENTYIQINERGRPPSKSQCDKTDQSAEHKRAEQKTLMQLQVEAESGFITTHFIQIGDSLFFNHEISILLCFDCGKQAASKKSKFRDFGEHDWIWK